jgi:hypothetical protein
MKLAMVCNLSHFEWRKFGDLSHSEWRKFGDLSHFECDCKIENQIITL